MAAVLSDGKFVAVWQSSGQDTSEYGVYAQRFNALGDPFGDLIQVNVFTADS